MAVMSDAWPAPIDRDTWRTLLRPALQVVDSLLDNGYGPLDFRLGGGTVLMLRFDHRLSKDVDIFTHDAQALSFITPRLNEVAERLSTGYEEQANVVKLLRPEGDIDFIVAAPVLMGLPVQHMDFEGRRIALDATAEILAKKLLYRAESFKARDVFDMVAALSLDRPAALAALGATRGARPALMARLATMAAVPPSSLTTGLMVSEAGRPFLDDMVARLQTAVAEVA